MLRRNEGYSCIIEQCINYMTSMHTNFEVCIRFHLKERLFVKLCLILMIQFMFTPNGDQLMQKQIKHFPLKQRLVSACQLSTSAAASIAGKLVNSSNRNEAPLHITFVIGTGPRTTDRSVVVAAPAVVIRGYIHVYLSNRLIWQPCATCPCVRVYTYVRKLGLAAVRGLKYLQMFV